MQPVSIKGPHKLFKGVKHVSLLHRRGGYAGKPLAVFSGSQNKGLWDACM